VCWTRAGERTYIKTEVRSIAAAPTLDAKLQAAADFFRVCSHRERTTTLTKSKGGEELCFTAFWPAPHHECAALIEAVVAASQRHGEGRHRLCKVCIPALPRTNFRRHLEQHLGVSYVCNATGCGRVFRGSHANLLQHVGKCKGAHTA